MQRLWNALSRATNAAAHDKAARPQGRCGECRFFRNDARYLEAMIPGLASLSSADASVRADDGICARHERYLGARASCEDFARRSGPATGDCGAA